MNLSKELHCVKGLVEVLNDKLYDMQDKVEALEDEDSLVSEGHKLADLNDIIECLEDAIMIMETYDEE